MSLLATTGGHAAQDPSAPIGSFDQVAEAIYGILEDLGRNVAVLEDVLTPVLTPANVSNEKKAAASPSGSTPRIQLLLSLAERLHGLNARVEDITRRAKP